MDIIMFRIRIMIMKLFFSLLNVKPDHKLISIKLKFGIMIKSKFFNWIDKWILVQQIIFIKYFLRIQDWRHMSARRYNPTDYVIVAPKIWDLKNKDVRGYTCPSGSPQYGLQSWDYDNDAQPIEYFKILSDGKLTVSTLLCIMRITTSCSSHVTLCPSWRDLNVFD